MSIKVITSVKNLHGRTVILRVDSDVDIVDKHIVDDTRLKASLDTIRFILEKGGDVNIIGHLGRPTPDSLKSFTLEPIALWFADKLHGRVSPIKIGRLDAWKITDRVNLIENIRFFKEEEDNNSEFARELALLGDIYVNDAFAVSHRSHASIEGITHFLPSFAGIHFEKEIEVLGKVLKDPARPLIVLIGGAKIETKLPMVEKMHKVADYVLVGGEIAEQDRVLIKVQHEKLEGNKGIVIVADSNDSKSDITPKSVENFCQILSLAKTIVWNGPVGIIGDGKKQLDSEEGTRLIANYVAGCKAYKIVGGGDTLMYLSRLGLFDKFDFVSTGGGAMLEFLSGKKLPGITPLERK